MPAGAARAAGLCSTLKEIVPKMEATLTKQTILSFASGVCEKSFASFFSSLGAIFASSRVSLSSESVNFIRNRLHLPSSAFFTASD